MGRGKRSGGRVEIWKLGAALVVRVAGAVSVVRKHKPVAQRCAGSRSRRRAPANRVYRVKDSRPARTNSPNGRDWREVVMIAIEAIEQGVAYPGLPIKRSTNLIC